MTAGRDVTPTTKAVLLVVIGVAWVALGIVNLARGHTGVGLLYVVLGVVCGLISLTVRTGRRSR